MRADPAKVLRYLSGLAPLPAADRAPDAVLLDRFIGQRDEAAFSVLVARHGPMVLRLCRRALGDSPDAEDAFQATFLVLARKAGAIRRPNHLAAWLHGTAYRVALKARARRRPAEVAAPAPEPADPQPDPLTRITARELLTALDEEIARLPEAYRLPLILCCLEGRTQEEAARQLGWSAGSVKGRLERGRARLHARLARRGLALSAALLALDAVCGPAAAIMPAARLAACAQAALRFAVGVRDANAGGCAAVTLAEGVLKAMLVSKIKIIAAVLLLVAVATSGTGSFLFRGAAAGEPGGPPVAAPTPPPAPQAKPPEQKKSASDQDLLQGTWVAVAIELDGVAFAAEQVKLRDYQLTIQGDRFTLRAGREKNYQIGTFTLNPDGKPKAIDFSATTIRPDATAEKVGPFRRPGIYAVDGNTLKICRAAVSEPRPRDFKTARKSHEELWVFRRAAGPPPAGAGAAEPGKEPAANDHAKLQGTWVAVAAEADGKARPDTVKQGFRLSIEGNRFTMGREIALHFPHGTFTLDPSKQPKAIDLTQQYGLPQEKPVLVPGIYALEGATLKLCLPLGTGKRPTDFTTAAGSGREVFVFQRPAAARPQKECFATREGNTVTLHPGNATFRVTDVMVNWFNSFKNNLHLSRAELAKVEKGAGDWDTEYGLICNAALPFSRCCAHVGDEGWGKDTVSFADLQVRVYVLDRPLDEVQRQIEERAAAKVKEITKQAAKITSDDNAPWKRRSLAYQRWYGDYGGGATVDFRVRQFDGHTVVFAFMYTDYTNQQAKVQAMLQSFRWGKATP